VDVLWCQAAQNIGLSNHQIRAKVHRPYNHNARPSQTDRRTDQHPDNSATIRSYAKMVGVLLQTVQIRLP